MKNKFKRAVGIYKEHGLITVVQRSLDWVLWRVKSKLFFDSVTEVSIEGNTAEFITKTRKEYSRFEDLMGEEPVIKDLLSEISPGDVFYDIGANVGMYTCFAGKNDDSGMVFAFEPHPKNADRLMQNLKLNNVSANIKRVALSNESGTAQLEIQESGETGVGSHSLATGETVHTTEIQTVRGDDITDVEKSPAVLKIDVEGAEMEVLHGLEESISDSRVIYCEIHPELLPEFGSQSKDVFSYFDRNGYEVEKTFEFGEGSSGFMIKAVNKHNGE